MSRPTPFGEIRMKKIALTLLAAAVTASPVSAGVAWNWGTPLCGGDNFETCISVNVAKGAADEIVVTIGNMGPGTITGVGLWNLPSDAHPISASTSIAEGWNTGGSNDINGVVGENSAKYAIGTTNGINDGLIPGLAPGTIATFTFQFDNETDRDDAFAQIGVGVHSQGYIGCSTKLFVTPNGVTNPYRGGSGNCLSVPEPSSLLLLGSGAAGLAFIAGRRRKNEIVDEDGNDLEI